MFSRIPLKAVIATFAVGLALAACVYFTRPVPVLPELNYVETIDGSHGKLVERSGRYGKFLGCSGYPRCRFTRNG